MVFGVMPTAAAGDVRGGTISRHVGINSRVGLSALFGLPSNCIVISHVPIHQNLVALEVSYRECLIGLSYLISLYHRILFFPSNNFV